MEGSADPAACDAVTNWLLDVGGSIHLNCNSSLSGLPQSHLVPLQRVKTAILSDLMLITMEGSADPAACDAVTNWLLDVGGSIHLNWTWGQIKNKMRAMTKI